MLRRLLIVPAVALLLTVCAGLSQAAPIRVVICPGQPVPAGWVVVGQGLCGTCAGGICVIIEKLP